MKRNVETTAELPVVGDLYDYEQDRLAFLVRLAREHGDVARVSRNVFFISGADLVGRVLTETNRCFAGPSDFLRKNLDGTADSPDLARWMRGRKAALPGLNKKTINEAIEASSSRFFVLAERRLDSWTPGKPIDVIGDLEGLMAGIIAEYSFGPAGEPLVPPVGKLRDALGSAAGSPFSLPSWLPTPRAWRERRALRETERIVGDLISERRREGQGGLPDLLDIMVAPEGWTREPSDREILELLVGVMLAGHGVPSAAMSWIWHLLAESPGTQHRLQSEVDEVFGENPLSARRLDQLPFTTAVVKETLRLYPPIWLLARKVAEDCELGGHPLRRGQFVMFSPYVVQRDPRYFERPDEFLPNRWMTDELAELPRHAYVPFGGGPRSCVGYKLALTDLVLLTAMMERRFTLNRHASDRMRVDVRRLLVPSGLVGSVANR